MSAQDSAVASEVAEQEVAKTARLGLGQSIQDVLEAAVAAGLFVYEEQSEGYRPGIPSIITYLRRRAEASGEQSQRSG